jgi:hypothetical protein
MLLLLSRFLSRCEPHLQKTPFLQRRPSKALPLLQMFLYSNRVLSEPIWSGNLGFYKYGASMSSKGFEASQDSAQAALQPLLDWLAGQVCAPSVAHLAKSRPCSFRMPSLCRKLMCSRRTSTPCIITSRRGTLAPRTRARFRGMNPTRTAKFRRRWSCPCRAIQTFMLLTRPLASPSLLLPLRM